MKLWKLTRWTLFHVLFCWLIWLAVNGSIPAGRLVGFWIWFGGSMMLLFAFSSEIKQQMRTKGRSVPGLLSHSMGSAIIAFLVWHGWITLAVVMLFAELAEAAIFDGGKEEA